jgi:hypothetical protein
MSTEELLALLQQCLANNSASEVTGLLLYGNGTFLQTLEGPVEIVDRLYEQIAADPRHTNVKCLYRKTTDRREYSDWSMGFKGISDKDLSEIEGLKDFTMKDFTSEYLAEHTAVAENLMAHYAYWDPLVRQVDEKEKAVKDMKKALAQTRGCLEIATLVIQSVVDAGRTSSLSDTHFRLCESTLESLKKSN